MTRRARREIASPVHAAFVLVALGMVAWAAGKAVVLGVSHTVTPGDPVTDAADVLFALSPVLVAAGVLALGWTTSTDGETVSRWSVALGGLVVGVGLGWLAWELAVHPAIDTAAVSSGQLTIAASYTVFGALPVGAALALVQRGPNRLLTALGGASAALAAGNVVFAATIDGAGIGGAADASTAARDALWVAALCGYVVASRLPAAQLPGAARSTARSMVAVHGPLVAAVLVSASFAAVRRSAVPDVTVGIAALAVVAVACWAVAAAWSSHADSEAAPITSPASTSNDLTPRADIAAVLDHLPDAAILVARDGTVLEANALACALTGRTREDLVGRNASRLTAAGDRHRAIDAFQTIMRGGPNVPLVYSLDGPGGVEVRVEATISDPARDAHRAIVTLRDVTARDDAARRLEAAQERFRRAFHSAPTGMTLATTAGLTLVDVNDAFCALIGRSRDEVVGSQLGEVGHPDDRRRLEAAVREADGGPIRMETRYIRSDGETVWARVSLTNLDGVDGAQLTIAHVEDITEQRTNSQRLEYAATHDQLTGLPNRHHFMSMLRERLVSSPVGSVAVLFIDLDNFKVINDSLGHAVGDQLLREMSERLRSVVRDRDTLGRFGGDEFMVMLDGLTGELVAADVAERLRTVVGKPLLIEDKELFVTASIGMATAQRRGITADELLRDADAAMYRAKARGRDCVEAFAPGTHESSVIALRTANELRHGLERGEIVPYYQPIVALSDGRLTGFEVLARWRHPDRGLVGPDQFLPMAEETGLIGEVGLAVLRTSLAQVALWRARRPAFADVNVSVNVSVRQLVDGRFLDQVAEALAESGLGADALWLEITETALLSDVKLATVALRELRNLGLHLAVDDFGTGYSSLTYLKRFPIEAIKIDRTFVNGLGIEAEDTTIVEALVNLGRSLGLVVVAEGVETPLQLGRLREVGCERGQGYLFGRPRPAELIEAERLDA